MIASLRVLVVLLACTSVLLVQSVDVPLVGSCTNDNECAVTHFCTFAGTCAPLENDQLPVMYRFKTTAYVFMSAGIGCAAMCFVAMMGSYCLSLCSPSRPPTWSHTEDVKCAYVFMLVFAAFFFSFFFALSSFGALTEEYSLPFEPPVANQTLCDSLDSVGCAPYLCNLATLTCYNGCVQNNDCAAAYQCTKDGLCELKTKGEIEGVRRSKVSPAAALLIAVGSGLCCCCCGGFIAATVFDEERDTDEENDRFLALTCIVSICMGLCVFIALFLPLALVSRPIKFPDAGTGAPCQFHEQCGLYFCDFESGACRSSCDKDYECQGEGTTCLDGRCSVTPLKGETRPILPTGLVIVVALSSGCLCCCCLWCGLGLAGREVRPRGTPAQCLVCLCCVTVVVVMGLSVGLSGTTTPLTEAGNGSRCAALEALVCEPYLCDMGTAHCYQGCEADSQCSSSTMCVAGLCVARVTSGVYPNKTVAPWLTALIVVTCVLLTCGLIFAIFIPRMPFDYSAPLDLLLANLQDVQIGALIGLALTLFACTVIVSLCVGLPLLLAGPRLVPTAMHPPPNVNVTVGCTGATASVCFPFYCDVEASVCNTGCAADRDCREGLVCDEGGHCGTPIEALPLPSSWIGVIAMAAVLVAFGLAVLVGSCKSGANLRTYNMYGLRPERLAPITCFGFLAAALVAFYVVVPLKYNYMRDAGSLPGDGLMCTSLDSMVCAPYYCDMFMTPPLCHTSCGDWSECRDGFSCVGGECVEENAEPVVLAYLGVGLVATLVVAVVGTTPFFRRKQRFWRDLKLKRSLEAEERQLREFEAFRARVQALHPVTLNIAPASPLSPDPSAPFPLLPAEDDDGTPFGATTGVDGGGAGPAGSSAGGYDPLPTEEDGGASALVGTTEEAAGQQGVGEPLAKGASSNSRGGGGGGGGGGDGAGGSRLGGTAPDIPLVTLQPLPPPPLEASLTTEGSPVTHATGTHSGEGAQGSGGGGGGGGGGSEGSSRVIMALPPPPSSTRPHSTLLSSSLIAGSAGSAPPGPSTAPDSVSSSTALASGLVGSTGGSGSAAWRVDGRGGKADDSESEEAGAVSGSSASGSESALLQGDKRDYGGLTSTSTSTTTTTTTSTAAAATTTTTANSSAGTSTYKTTVTAAAAAAAAGGASSSSSSSPSSTARESGAGAGVGGFASARAVAVPSTTAPLGALTPSAKGSATVVASGSGRGGANPAALSCSICLSNRVSVRLSGSSCTHGYCDECAVSSLEAMVAAGQFPAMCPGCRADAHRSGGGAAAAPMSAYIPSDILERLVNRSVVSIDFGRKFIQQQLLRAFLPSEVVFCPVCTVMTAAPTRAEIKVKQGKRDGTAVACPECETSFCVLCNAVYDRGHKGLTCEAYAARLRSADDINTRRLMASTVKQCPNCGMGTSHYRGHSCHHIAVPNGCANCHHHYCIVCLEPHPCSLRGHGLYCDDRCDCPPCPDCKPGFPCNLCEGDSKCPSCHPPASH